MVATMTRSADEIYRTAALEAAGAELERARVEVADRIRELDSRRAKEIPPLEKRVAQAEKRLAQLEPDFRAAEAEAKALRLELTRTRAEIHDTKQALRAQLRVRLPFLEIEEARRRLVELQDETRELLVKVEYGKKATHPVTGHSYFPTTHSTAPAKARRLEYLNEALRSDSGLLARAAELPTRAEALEAIGEIFANVPEVGEPEPIR